MKNLLFLFLSIYLTNNAINAQSVIIDDVGSDNQPIEVISQGTSIDYDEGKIKLFNVEDLKDCPKTIHSNIEQLSYSNQKSSGIFDGGMHLWTLFNVSPNPATNTATIQLPEIATSAQLNIYNNVGNVVYSKSITSTTETDLNINLATWPKGIYFINLSDESRTKNLKFIVQ